MNRPNINNNLSNTGAYRPNISAPGGSINRPGGGGAGTNRPAINPSNRPGGNAGVVNRPGGNQPGTGQVHDFLGMDRPIERPANLPNRPGDGGLANRPGAGGGGVQRPGIDNRPNRPGGDYRPNRPGDWNRPNRPIQIGGNNTVINNRPTWANISGNRVNQINGRWNTAIRGNNWANRPIRNQWTNWGNGVRGRWDGYGRGWANGWFAHGWWDNHRFPSYGWGYWNKFTNYPYNHWWTVPAWGAVTGFFNWASQPGAVTQPIYYDYGDGGNVTYQDNSVYIGGQQVATADEFAESAAALATVPPPTNEDEAKQAEWMPLGTFGVSSNDKEAQPTRVIQLAVNKDGVISGTAYNTETDEAKAILGQVDKQTQRVAFRIGENENVVAETGLYNLTQDEAPLLVHFGKDKQETWLLIRMKGPEDDQSGAAGEGAGSTQ